RGVSQLVLDFAPEHAAQVLADGPVGASRLVVVADDRAQLAGQVLVQALDQPGEPTVRGAAAAVAAGGGAPDPTGGVAGGERLLGGFLDPVDRTPGPGASHPFLRCR